MLVVSERDVFFFHVLVRVLDPIFALLCLHVPLRQTGSVTVFGVLAVADSGRPIGRLCV